MQKALLAFLATIGSAGLLHASPAFAHIDLLEPEARSHGTAASGDTDIDDNSNLKNAPCGQVTTGRTDRVARYAPGETIRIRLREENAHVSYFRVALDLDGNEFPLRAQFPGGPETQAEAASAEAALGTEFLLLVYREDNDTPGFVHELEVTLPEQSCDTCTLQVLQYMYDDPSAPYYFQCADLVIADDAARDAGVATDAAVSSPSGAPPATSSPGGSGGASSAGGGSSAGAPSVPDPAGGGASGSPAAGGGGVSGAPVRAAADDGGGCSISGAPRGVRGGVGVGLIGLALLGLSARRHRAAPASRSGCGFVAGSSRSRSRRASGRQRRS